MSVLDCAENARQSSRTPLDARCRVEISADVEIFSQLAIRSDSIGA
jgi:hypothetical protein